MGWYENLKSIRQKLFYGFLLMVVFCLILAFLGIFNIYRINNSYKYTIETTNTKVRYAVNIIDYFRSLDSYSKDIMINIDNVEEVEKRKVSFLTNYGYAKGQLTEYKAFTENDQQGGNISVISNALDSLEKIKGYLEESVRYIGSGDKQKAIDIINNQLLPLSDTTVKAVLGEYSNTNINVDNVVKENTQNVNTIEIVLIVTSILVILFSVLISFMVSGSIIKPLGALNKAVTQIADGNLQTSVALNYRDEVGQLAANVDKVVSVFRSLSSELNTVYDHFVIDGNTDTVIDEQLFKGDYKIVADNMNRLISSVRTDTNDILQIIVEVAEGNFNVKPKVYPGKKRIINESLDRLLGNLSNINNDVKKLARAASQGDLKRRMNAGKYSGDWNNMALGFNALLDSIIAPIEETIAILEQMSMGNLKVNIKGDYKGSFADMKDTINTTIKALSGYIDEISNTLIKMANQNFNLQIAGEYIGDFASIKESLNHVIDTFNKVLSEINTSAEKVSNGSTVISQTSTVLSEGVSEQTMIVSELVSTLEKVKGQTNKNSENAETANHLTVIAKENALSGNEEMNSMLLAMNEINDASNSISKIIKAIQEIASQTNLLALNAAVEAARAGQYGKGFTVVADQVRTLAARSKQAAQESTELIQSTVEKTGKGMKIANQSAEKLQTIVSQVTEVSELIHHMTAATKDQSEAIEKINQGIGKISNVTQTNYASSHESAESARELSEQAYVFRELVSKFSLKTPKTKVNEIKTIDINASKPYEPIHQQASVIKDPIGSSPSPLREPKNIPTTKYNTGTTTQSQKPFKGTGVNENKKSQLVSQEKNKKSIDVPSLPAKTIVSKVQESKAKPTTTTLKDTNKPNATKVNVITDKPAGGLSQKTNERNEPVKPWKKENKVPSGVGMYSDYESKDFGKY